MIQTFPGFKILAEDQLIDAEYRIDGSPDFMGHICQEIALCAVRALSPHLLLQQHPLHAHKRPDGQHGEDGREEQRHEKNDDVAYDCLPGLGRQLRIKPVCGKIHGNNSCYISR